VIDEKQQFKGLIYVEEVLRKAVNSAEAPTLTANDLMEPAAKVLLLSDTMQVVLEKMEQENAWLLPVLNDQGQFLGFVSKTAIFNKYRAMLRRQADYMES